MPVTTSDSLGAGSGATMPSPADGHVRVASLDDDRPRDSIVRRIEFARARDAPREPAGAVRVRRSDWRGQNVRWVDPNPRVGAKLVMTACTRPPKRLVRALTGPV